MSVRNNYDQLIKIFTKKNLDKITAVKNVDMSSVVNVLFVIYGLRPAYWYDQWELDKSHFTQLLSFLDKFKNKGIRYKFEDDVISGNKIISEGPLIYNTNKLSSRLIHDINNKDINKLYKSKQFGEILGYGCPANPIQRNKYDCLIGYNFVINDDKGKYIHVSKEGLYGFWCNITELHKKLKQFYKISKLQTQFIKKIDERFHIEIDITLGATK